jgi:hypothetical protein
MGAEGVLEGSKRETRAARRGLRGVEAKVVPFTVVEKASREIALVGWSFRVKPPEFVSEARLPIVRTQSDCSMAAAMPREETMPL